MIKLLHLEWLKVKGYKLFWATVILYLLALVAVLIVTEYVIKSKIPAGFTFIQWNAFSFPNVHNYLPWLALFARILSATILIFLVSNEINYRTFRQQIIDGASRAEIYWSKILTIFMITLVSTFVLLAVSFTMGFLNTPNISFEVVTENMAYHLGYFISIFGYLIIAFFITLLVRNPALSLLLLIVYCHILEPALTVDLIPEEVGQFLPQYAFYWLVPPPAFLEGGSPIPLNMTWLSLGIVWIGIFGFIIYRIFQRRDW